MADRKACCCISKFHLECLCVCGGKVPVVSLIALYVVVVEGMLVRGRDEI